MCFKMHENSNFDPIFVERSENDGTVFNMKLVLDAKVKIVLFKIFELQVVMSTQFLLILLATTKEAFNILKSTRHVI